MPFLQWCSNGWEEDDELRKADYGVGSAAVFVLLVALVSRQPAVVALPLLFSVVASSLCFCHLVSLQTILCLSLSVSPPFSFFLLLLCVVVLFFFTPPFLPRFCSLLPSALQKISPPFFLSFLPVFIGNRGRGSPYPVQAQGMVAGAWVF